MPPFEETTNRRAGYLASLFNIPPLIFRFQFNPESITDKKSFTYQESDFGVWALDKAKAATDISSTLSGLATDVKELGARLSGTKPLEARGGEPRIISMDFVLDARRAGPKDGDTHYDGSIAPDLAVLRAFLYPPYDLIDLTKLLLSEFKDVPSFIKPPECSLSYGGISLTCVMTDLNIRVTAFDQKTDPLRAEVSMTLKEQSHSVSHVVDFFTRNVHTFRAPFRENLGEDLLVTSGLQGVKDLLVTSGILGMVDDLFS